MRPQCFQSSAQQRRGRLRQRWQHRTVARGSIAGDPVAVEITDVGSQAAGLTHPAHGARLDYGAAAALVKALLRRRVVGARSMPTAEPRLSAAAPLGKDRRLLRCERAFED